MNVPKRIIQTANSILGMKGQPHRIFILGDLINTGGFAWRLPRESEGAMGFIQVYHELAKMYHDCLEAGNIKAAEQVASQLKEMSAPYQPEMVQGIPVLDLSDLSSVDPYEGVNKFWWDLKTQLRDDPVVVYRTDLQWMTYDVAVAETLIIAPGKDQYAMLDIEETNGVNWGFETEDIKTKLYGLDQKFGIDLIGAGFDTLEFLLQRAPEGVEIQELGDWLYEFCPSIGEVPRDFSKRRVALFWD